MNAKERETLIDQLLEAGMSDSDFMYLTDSELKNLYAAWQKASSTAPRCNRITLKDAKKELREMGMILTKNEDGEYRVTFKHMSPARAEAVASYSTDLDDAVGTAKDMYERQQRK